MPDGGLPLFPLGTVLFPGVLLPLQVFEPRYRQLVADLGSLPPRAPRRFGVVAIRSGTEVGAGRATALHTIGCVAEVQEMTTHEDGRSEVLANGSRRFRIRHVDDTSRPYLTATVDWLDDPAGDEAEAARRSVQVAESFRTYQRLLVGTQVTSDQELPSDPVVLAYLVAAAMILEVPDKQRLLEAPDAAARLAVAAELLRRENVLISRLNALPAVDLVRPRGSLPH